MSSWLVYIMMAPWSYFKDLREEHFVSQLKCSLLRQKSISSKATMTFIKFRYTHYRRAQNLNPREPTTKLNRFLIVHHRKRTSDNSPSEKKRRLPVPPSFTQIKQVWVAVPIWVGLETRQLSTPVCHGGRQGKAFLRAHFFRVSAAQSGVERMMMFIVPFSLILCSPFDLHTISVLGNIRK